MFTLSKRLLTGLLAVPWLCLSTSARERKADFIDEAFRARDEAIGAGDQPYGAVLVMRDTILGYGPSRVVAENNQDAHAERVALREAQRKWGLKDLSGAVIYSTSRPCALCQVALKAAGVSRMVYGREGRDGGAPAA